MARPSTSLDLSEFFSNDDSDGHRLAEFLQKRRGGVQRQNFLFMNCEPQRLSLDVQLEKLPPSQQQATSEKNNEKQIENVEECDKNVENVGNDEVENELASLHGETVGTLPGSNNDTNEHVAKVSNAQPLPSEGKSPSSPEKPQNISPPLSSIKQLSPSRPLSPRLASIRKSGGVSPSDRLRRYSLKRLTKIGRRTLLQEFESTVSDSNFDPPICSTPLSQPLPENPPSSPSSSQSQGVENLIPKGTEKGPSSNESCCEHTDTLIRTLQRKDEELKNYMESILENTMRKIQNQEKENNKSKSEDTQTKATSPATKSPLKRTYTVEKGNTFGQVILTPDRTTKQSPPHSRFLRSQTEPSPCKMLKTPERSVNRSMISIRVKSPQNIISPRHLNNSMSYTENRSNLSNCNISHRGSKMLEISRSLRQQEQQVPTTPPRNNVSIIFPSQDVEIPETQDVTPARENSIIIQSDNREMPLVVIPVNQTYNRTCEEEILSNNTIITARTKLSLNPKKALSTKQNEQTAEPSNEQCNQLAEDNLRLTDILTDDDDETPKAAVSRTIENNSQAPLNLAPSATNKRTKRLRKRSISRRRLQMDNSQLLSTETETEHPPQAHSIRRTVKRKHIPLNRAPGTPLNGEKFAQELARMSNYEILDLRKRNSLGRVFAISGRKSVRSHEEAVKKQHELDDQIEIELLKRNLDEATDNQHTLNDQANVGEEIDECPPAPDEFRDSLDKRQNTQNKSKESSLIDEKSTDRISFKNKRNSLEKLRPSKSNKKQIPEVLKQYLEVSKMLTKKKRNKNINSSKRSLYTQGNSDTEEINSSLEKSPLESNRSSSRNKKKSIPYIPSPPRSDVDEITTLKVVSPPPPLNITPRKSLLQAHQQTTPVDVEENSYNTNTTTNEALPPPPPGFESDSGVSSNHYNIHSNTNNTLQTDQVNTINQTAQITTNNNSHTDNDDDQIFKKPLQTAPKRRGRPNNVSKIPSNDLVQSTSDSQESADNSADATDGSLRRSKRGQVPLKHPIPIFQLLFQQTFNRRMEMIEKKKQKDKQISRELSKANKQKKIKDSIQSVSSQKSTKTSQPGTGRTRLPTVPENEPYITSLHQDIEILTKKKTPKVKESKVKRKQNKNNNNNNIEEIQPHDNFECSRIIMSTPPPVDHLNNVFDQLRNTSSTLNTSPPQQQSRQHQQSQPGSSRDLVEKVKPFKVRVARLKSTAQPSGYDNVRVSSTNNNNNSNYELISWLKNISESDSSVARNGENDEIFKEMRISAASNLSFTELQGVEYAFYDTDEKASLGYLRFKPRQIKPKKKAKRFHLHFVTLVGNFRITANDKESRIGVGDMVAIEKSVYYDIENITDDIGILMVIKK